MTIKVTTTIQKEVEREITLPYFFKAWPLDTVYKVIDENTVICVDHMTTFKGISVTNFSSTVKGYMENERSQVITEQEFNEALLITQVAIAEKTGQPFVDALKHLKEMTYIACSCEVGQDLSRRIGEALDFMKAHESMLKPDPAVDLSEILSHI